MTPAGAPGISAGVIGWSVIGVLLCLFVGGQWTVAAVSSSVVMGFQPTGPTAQAVSPSTRTAVAAASVVEGPSGGGMVDVELLEHDLERGVHGRVAERGFGHGQLERRGLAQCRRFV